MASLSKDGNGWRILFVCPTTKKRKTIRTITPKDADLWTAWLKTDENLAENTIKKRSQFAKQFFSMAVKRKLIPEDPFASLTGSGVSVPERQYFIPRETVDALLDQCHGPEDRLLLVFARFMGVRVPSEIHPLKWTDADWEGQRIVISSPKTKRHRGGDKRVILLSDHDCSDLADCTPKVAGPRPLWL